MRFAGCKSRLTSVAFPYGEYVFHVCHAFVSKGSADEVDNIHV